MIDLKNIPKEPGCYLFKDENGKIIYIGKAKDLRKRVSSYFLKKDHDTKTSIMVSKIDDAEYFATDNEVEALILENNLIKKHSPKYNIDLKDSKRYAYLVLTKEKFPRLVLSRDRKIDGEYFGPFVSGEDREYIKGLMQRMFQLRTCRRLPKRACLRYHINLCKGPCIGKVSEEEYLEDVSNVANILRGKTKKLEKDLERDMKNFSEDQEYEKAILARNRINAISWLQEKQNVQRNKVYDEDVVNYFVKDDKFYVMLFNVSRGILENKQEFEFDIFEETDTLLEEFLIQFYSENKVPKEIILPKKIDSAIVDFLTEKRGSNVNVVVPKQGEKKELLKLVEKNIMISFFGDIDKLENLKKQLGLQQTPKTIECFDISHLAGTATVASMVQFRNAKPSKENYRRFKIKTVKGIDDFRAIAEVVRRRYKRIVEEGHRLPDLIIIDGGKGQLRFAFNELKKLGAIVPIISVAKKT